VRLLVHSVLELFDLFLCLILEGVKKIEIRVCDLFGAVVSVIVH